MLLDQESLLGQARRGHSDNKRRTPVSVGVVGNLKKSNLESSLLANACNGVCFAEGVRGVVGSVFLQVYLHSCWKAKGQSAKAWHCVPHS